jgi:hypothetical protein
VVLNLNAIVFDDFNLRSMETAETKIPLREARAREEGLPIDEQLKRLATSGETTLEVAFKHYALERPHDDITRLLQRGARALAAHLEVAEAGDKTFSWYYAQYVSWATAFADGPTRQTLSALPSLAKLTQRDNGSLYSHILTSFLRGETVDEPLAALRTACMDRKATKFLSTTVLACTDAMRATLDGDAAGLSQALEDLVTQHKQDVKGEYRTLALRGFMNAYGLFYVRIALERGIPLTIDSPYLPIWLVDLCRTTPPSAS